MYGWRDDTPDWKGKGGYSFGAARAKFDKAAVDAGATGSRTYRGRSSADMKLVDPRGKTLTSDSKNPVIVAVDVTGSMAEWPGQIFDRLPLLYKTLAKYRPDLDLCFAAIGDATCDRNPLQVSDFSHDIKGLEANLNAIGCEGGGGGHITESYELFAYFVRDHIKTPNATSPFLLIYGDETPYPQVDPRQVKHFVGDTLESALDTAAVFKDVMQRFNVFYLQKPYGSGGDRGTTATVREDWSKYIGAQRVVPVTAMDRAVDHGLGLIAKLWGEYDDFKLSVTARHDDPAVLSGVDKSLRHIDASPAPRSMLKLPAPAKSKLTKPLA